MLRLSRFQVSTHTASHPRLPKLARTALLAAGTLVLSACGGGQDDDPPGTGPDGTLPPPSINALAGEWVQKGCVRVGAESFKKTLRATISSTSSTGLDYFEGVLSFNSSDCSGPFQQVGPSRLGTVMLVRSEANQSLAAHWGMFFTVTNTRFGAIWTLQTGNTLCLLGDAIPSIQPTLAAVSASLAAVPAGNCFGR